MQNKEKELTLLKAFVFAKEKSEEKRLAKEIDDHAKSLGYKSYDQMCLAREAKKLLLWI